MSFYSILVFILGHFLVFFSTKNSRENNGPSKTTLKYQWVWTSWKLLNQFYSSSLKLYHCSNFESHIWQCSSRAVKTQDYCYLAGVERSVCIRLVYIAMSNWSMAKEFTSTKIKYHAKKQKKNQTALGWSSRFSFCLKKTKTTKNLLWVI